MTSKAGTSKYGIAVCLAIVACLFLVQCDNDNRTCAKGVRFLKITTNIPSNLVIKGQTRYEATSNLFWCKSLSAANGSWVPRLATEVWEVAAGEQLIRLFHTGISLCRFRHFETAVEMRDTGNARAWHFYLAPNADGERQDGLQPLPDTIRLVCYECSRPREIGEERYIRMDPIIWTRCELQGEFGDVRLSGSYMFSESSPDTVSLFIDFEYSSEPLASSLVRRMMRRNKEVFRK